MLQGVADGDGRAVHRARVATRRLRELLPVVPASADATSKLGRRLRNVTRHLGLLRELDVTALLVDELRQTHPEYHEAFATLAARLDRDRAAARRSLAGARATLERTRLARRLEELADRTAAHGRDRGRRAVPRWDWAVHARVVARAGQLRQATAAAGAIYLPERLHGVRIAIKKLRYALELLVELGGANAADVAMLKERQDVLGRMHDLQILMARARRLQASPDAGTSGPQLAAVVDDLEDECRRLHARYLGERIDVDALAVRLGARGRDGMARPERPHRRANG